METVEYRIEIGGGASQTYTIETVSYEGEYFVYVFQEGNRVSTFGPFESYQSSMMRLRSLIKVCLKGDIRAERNLWI